MVELNTDFNSRKIALVKNIRALLNPFFTRDNGFSVISDMIYIQDLWDENREIGIKEIGKTRKVARNLLLDAQEFDLNEQDVSNLNNALIELRLLTEPSTYQLNLPGITL